MERNTLTDQHLEVFDYIIIVSFMIFPLTIGAYYAYVQRKGTTVISYLLADRKVKYLAITMSSFATMISTTTLIGIPADIYTYGAIFILHLVLEVFMIPFYTKVLIPIYVNLNSCSMYTYHQLRYNKFLWKTSAIVGIINMLFTLSITIVGSSNVFVRVTGIGIWTSSILVAFVCILYTTVGGMRAVIWTDFFQGIIIIVTLFLIMMLGTNYADGFSNVWTTSLKGQRLDIFNTKFDMTERHTMWSSLFAFLLTTISYQAGSQITVQRYLAAKDLKTAQKAAVLGITMKHVNMVFIVYTGLMIYTVNSTCDPVTGLGLNQNQLVPDFVMKAFGPYTGLPGIFVAGIMAALLSTMSSILNGLSAVTIQDVISNDLKNKLTEKKKVIVCQILVVFYGIVGLVGIYIIQSFPNVFQAQNIAQVFNVSNVALILIGTFLPQANSKAVMMAFVCGLAINVWIGFGNLLYGHRHPTKPMDTSGCSRVTNNTWVNSTGSGSIYEKSFTVMSLWNRTEEVQRHVKYNEGLRSVYDVSVLWLVPTTALSILILSYLFTFILGVENKRFNCMHLIPPAVQKLHRYLPKTARKVLLCDIYDDTDTSSGGQQPPEERKFTIIKTNHEQNNQ